MYFCSNFVFAVAKWRQTYYLTDLEPPIKTNLLINIEFSRKIDIQDKKLFFANKNTKIHTPLLTENEKVFLGLWNKENESNAKCQYFEFLTCIRKWKKNDKKNCSMENSVQYRQLQNYTQWNIWCVFENTTATRINEREREREKVKNGKEKKSYYLWHKIHILTVSLYSNSNTTFGQHNISLSLSRFRLIVVQNSFTHSGVPCVFELIDRPTSRPTNSSYVRTYIMMILNISTTTHFHFFRFCVIFIHSTCENDAKKI